MAIDHRLSKVVLLHAGYLQSNYSQLFVLSPTIGTTELSGVGIFEDAGSRVYDQAHLVLRTAMGYIVCAH